MGGTQKGMEEWLCAQFRSAVRLDGWAVVVLS